MDFFDLHADTVSTCLDKGENMFSNSLHLDLKRGNELGKWVQTFAFWIDNVYKNEDAYNRFLSQLRFFKTQCEQYQEYISPFENAANVKENHCNFILSVEGGEMLNGDISRLYELKDIWVRFFTLVWNGECQLGFGSDTGVKTGLKPFGKQVVKTLNELDITVDVSHLNEAGFYDVASISEKAFVATHSNAKSVCNHCRNLSDEQIKIILQRNGLIGLNFHKPFLSKDIEKNTSIYDILVHTEHFLSLGCENILCIGSDFDGACISEEINDIKRLENIYSNVIKYYSKNIADKIFYKNAIDFITR